MIQPAWGRIEGGVFSSSLAKFFSERERKAIAEVMGNGENDLILFQAGKDPKTLRLNMGRIRLLVDDLHDFMHGGEAWRLIIEVRPYTVIEKSEELFLRTGEAL